MLKVLVVEDNAAYRQSVHRLLAERFPMMQIAEAADAQDALREALSGSFDLIFMDIRLPNGNGLDLTKIIKRDLPDVVICVMSSHSVVEYREAAVRSGASHFLVKGESTEVEMVGLVESLLNHEQVIGNSKLF